MTAEDKQELTKALQEENIQLKNQILQLQERAKKLENKIADLAMVAAGPRRGMPWS